MVRGIRASLDGEERDKVFVIVYMVGRSFL